MTTMMSARPTDPTKHRRLPLAGQSNRIVDARSSSSRQGVFRVIIVDAFKRRPNRAKGQRTDYRSASRVLTRRNDWTVNKRQDGKQRLANSNGPWRSTSTTRYEFHPLSRTRLSHHTRSSHMLRTVCRVENRPPRANRRRPRHSRLLAATDERACRERQTDERSVVCSSTGRLSINVLRSKIVHVLHTLWDCSGSLAQCWQHYRCRGRPNRALDQSVKEGLS